jgi:hypothetical protein
MGVFSAYTQKALLDLTLGGATPAPINEWRQIETIDTIHSCVSVLA